MKLEIVFSREKMVENNIIESIFLKTLKETTEERGLRYTIDDMNVVLYGQGLGYDLSAMFSISGQLLDVEWIDNLIVSCKFFEEDNDEDFEDWKQGYAEMRERKQERERKKLTNG